MVSRIIIEPDELRNQFKKRNLKAADVAEEMGHGRNYFSDILRRKSIPRHAAVFLSKNYNINVDDYKLVQQAEKPLEKPHREERFLKDMTDKQMYQLIYSAVYHAVKKAWAE